MNKCSCRIQQEKDHDNRKRQRIDIGRNAEEFAEIQIIKTPKVKNKNDDSYSESEQQPVKEG